MLHGIDYPDENTSQNFNVRFWDCIMNDGIITFPLPDSDLIKRRTVFENQPIKEFIIGQNYSVFPNEGGDE